MHCNLMVLIFFKTPKLYQKNSFSLSQPFSANTGHLSVFIKLFPFPRMGFTLFSQSKLAISYHITPNFSS